ncbi:MAG: polysaccharide deacetylase family protein [Bacteroidota bacterium]
MKDTNSSTENLVQQSLLGNNLSSIHELPVLMYHRVVERKLASAEYDIHITQQNMEKQLLFLKHRGFETIGFEDLLHRQLPKKPIILTFDDGYEDNYYYLFPLLKKYQMKAVIYIIGDRQLRNNAWDIQEGLQEAKLLTPNQIMEMLKSGLLEFGAHSMSHPDLTKLSPNEIHKEIGGSKNALETFLSKPVVSFAYPYGSVSEEIKSITAQEGFTFGIAVESGPIHFRNDLMEIHRIYIPSWTSIFNYRIKTCGFYLRYQRLSWIIKRNLGRIR